MENVREKVSAELGSLVAEGEELLQLINKDSQYLFLSRYQEWYTKALSVVRQLCLDRLDDFRNQYSAGNWKGIPTYSSYVLDDYAHGVVVTQGFSKAFDVHAAAQHRFYTQLQIVSAARTRLSGILGDIRGLLQADLFDSEVDASRELHKNGYHRAAGAVAGVVLEGHLKELVRKHDLKLRPKKGKRTLADYYEALRAAEIIDVPQWRWMQRLADIRNLCDHKRTRDPTADEVAELIDGADRAAKTLN